MLALALLGAHDGDACPGPKAPCLPASVTDPALFEAARAVMARPDFGEWSARVASTGYCANPAHLRGVVARLDRQGVIGPTVEHRSLMVRCGNRRASVCPSCSFTYSGDVWQVLATGISGGRHDVPIAVAAHPLVFLTLTAPSFGPVHTTRESPAGRPLPCRPRRPVARTACPHGRPAWCARTHEDGDLELGTPLCGECFDYAGLVAFNWHAPSLWQRFTIALRRDLAVRLGVSEAELGRRVRVQYAKVAEFQRRGAVHFHAVVRLDGRAGDVVDRGDGCESEKAGGAQAQAFPPPALPVGVDTLCAPR